MKVDMSPKAIDARLRWASLLNKLWRSKGRLVHGFDVTHLRFEEYEAFIQSKRLVVIHFWAEWNSYDVKQRENLSQVDSNYAYDVRFGAVDIDDREFWEVAKILKVLNVPALVYYKDGKHIETVIGLCPKEKVEAKLNQLLR